MIASALIINRNCETVISTAPSGISLLLSRLINVTLLVGTSLGSKEFGSFQRQGFDQKTDQALEQLNKGKYTELTSKDEIHAWFDPWFDQGRQQLLHEWEADKRTDLTDLGE